MTSAHWLNLFILYYYDEKSLSRRPATPFTVSYQFPQAFPTVLSSRFIFLCAAGFPAGCHVSTRPGDDGALAWLFKQSPGRKGSIWEVRLQHNPHLFTSRFYTFLPPLL